MLRKHQIRHLEWHLIYETRVLFPLQMCACTYEVYQAELDVHHPLGIYYCFYCNYYYFSWKIFRWVCVFSAVLLHIPHNLRQNQMSLCWCKFNLIVCWMQCSLFLRRTPYQCMPLFRKGGLVDSLPMWM